MKAISIIQPWATLIATGQKSYETRSWPTSYRGVIAIHASRSWPKRARDIASREVVAGQLEAAGYTPDRYGTDARPGLPLGAIVAVARIAECVASEDFIREVALGTREVLPLERILGDFSAKRFAFRLEAVTPVAPIHCLGALNLWTVPPDLAADAIRQAIEAGMEES